MLYRRYRGKYMWQVLNYDCLQICTSNGTLQDGSLLSMVLIGPVFDFWSSEGKRKAPSSAMWPPNIILGKRWSSCLEVWMPPHQHPFLQQMMFIRGHPHKVLTRSEPCLASRHLTRSHCQSQEFSYLQVLCLKCVRILHGSSLHGLWANIHTGTPPAVMRTKAGPSLQRMHLGKKTNTFSPDLTNRGLVLKVMQGA